MPARGRFLSRGPRLTGKSPRRPPPRYNAAGGAADKRRSPTLFLFWQTLGRCYLHGLFFGSDNGRRPRGDFFLQLPPSFPSAVPPTAQPRTPVPRGMPPPPAASCTSRRARCGCQHAASGHLHRWSSQSDKRQCTEGRRETGGVCDQSCHAPRSPVKSHCADKAVPTRFGEGARASFEEAEVCGRWSPEGKPSAQPASSEGLPRVTSAAGKPRFIETVRSRGQIACL